MGLDERTKAAAAAHKGLALTPGQKVLDCVTGFVGEVLDGMAAHRAVQGTATPRPSDQVALFTVPEVRLVESYRVQLSTGATVRRELGELVTLPANLIADLEDFG